MIDFMLFLVDSTVTSRKGRVSRNSLTNWRVQKCHVTSRKGRVSRNLKTWELKCQKGIYVPRKGRVSRNSAVTKELAQERSYVPQGVCGGEIIASRHSPINIMSRPARGVSRNYRYMRIQDFGDASRPARGV